MKGLCEGTFDRAERNPTTTLRGSSIGFVVAEIVNDLS
jgi:hypothetical protein